MTERKGRAETGKYRSIYVTPRGCGGVVAGDEGLLEVFLPDGRTSAETDLRIARSYPRASEQNSITRNAANLLARFFSGVKVRFDLPLDLRSCTEFQRSVYRIVVEIPYGVVKTYAEVAAEIGRPGASRGIGSAMARNPLPIVIPCHRVIGSDGNLTGYSAPGGTEMKRSLLHMEGVSFREGKVKK